MGFVFFFFGKRKYENLDLVNCETNTIALGTSSERLHLNFNLSIGIRNLCRWS